MNHVIVGIGVFIYRDDLILLGKRKGAHGEGQWAFPGGKQEHGETLYEGALRELSEEIGPQVKVERLDLLCVGDMMQYSPKHYLDVGVCARWVSGEPVVMEPDKCEEWKWFHRNKLPDNLFGSVKEYVEAWKGNEMYWNDK